MDDSEEAEMEMHMRITKKWLRENKGSMSRRMRELVMLTDEQLLAEMDRCFPNMEPGWREELKSSHGKALDFMLQDLLELAIPSHYCD